MEKGDGRWMAEVGEYSDRAVYGPFTSAEKAKTFCETVSRRRYPTSWGGKPLTFGWEFATRGEYVQTVDYESPERDTWTCRSNVSGANWYVSFWPDDPEP